MATSIRIHTVDRKTAEIKNDVLHVIPPHYPTDELVFQRHPVVGENCWHWLQLSFIYYTPLLFVTGVP